MSAVGAISSRIPNGLPGQGPAKEAAAMAVRPRSAKPLGARPPLQASYSYDKILRQVVIVLSNPETGGVVMQVPPPEIRNMAARLLEISTRAFESAA